MAKQTEHGKLIVAAAKAALTPIGCKRIGQSRCWISDEGSWVILVEFQPSGWSRGSYLNVNPQWLWMRYGTGIVFDRPADFIEFDSVEQFAPLIESMVAIAVRAVLDMRARFRTPRDVYEYFASRISRDGQPVYRAAIAAGLVGETEIARELFERMQAMDAQDFKPWIDLKAECARFAAHLDDPESYKAAILNTINEQRSVLRLPPDPKCLESMDSKAAM